MSDAAQIKMVKLLQKGALIVLLFLSIIILLFALVSGSEAYGGGMEGIWANKMNSLPWIGLLALVLIAYRNKILGGILLTFFGGFLVYFFNFTGQNFFLSTFVMCMIVLLLGLVIWITGSYLKTANNQNL